MKATKSTLSRKKISVWIIDDNKSYCIVLSESLNQSKRIKCDHYFHSVALALKGLQQHKKLPDVILLDIRMPGKTGIEGIRLFRERSPFSKIIMLTSYDDDREIHTALDQGANGYLLKSSTTEDIVRAMEKVIVGGVPLDPMITKKIMSMLIVSKNQKKLSAHLSKREKEIIEYISKGFSTETIAKKLFLSYYTVDTHLKNIYNKLNVHSRHTLVVKAFKEHLV